MTMPSSSNSLHSISFLLTILLLPQILFGGSRYFMDDDSDAADVKGSMIAIPIDVCFQSRVKGTAEYMKYECSPDGQSVNKTTYSDKNCATLTSETAFNKSITSSNSSCESPLHSFECDGDDAYIVVGSFYQIFGADIDCENLQSQFPTALGCHCTSETSSFSAQCNASYSNGSNQTSGGYGVITSYTDSVCGEVKKVSDHSTCHKETDYDTGYGITIQIYAEMQECADTAKNIVVDGNLHLEIFWMVIGISVGSVCLLFCCISFCCWMRWKQITKQRGDGNKDKKASLLENDMEAQPEPMTMQ